MNAPTDFINPIFFKFNITKEAQIIIFPKKIKKMVKICN